MSGKPRTCLSCKKHPTTGKWCKFCAPRMRSIALKEKYAAGYRSMYEQDSPTTAQKRRTDLVTRMLGVRYDLEMTE